MVDNPAFNLISLAIKLSDSYDDDEAAELISLISGIYADEVVVPYR